MLPQKDAKTKKASTMLLSSFISQSPPPLNNEGKEGETYNHANDTACCAVFAYVCSFLEEEDHTKTIDMEEVYTEEEAEKINTMMIMVLMAHLLVVVVGDMAVETRGETKV
eukprot:12979313-Ditylum_brightwellii.AAC.1